MRLEQRLIRLEGARKPGELTADDLREYVHRVRRAASADERAEMEDAIAVITRRVPGDEMAARETYHALFECIERRMAPPFYFG